MKYMNTQKDSFEIQPPSNGNRWILWLFRVLSLYNELFSVIPAGATHKKNCKGIKYHNFVTDMRHNGNTKIMIHTAVNKET